MAPSSNHVAFTAPINPIGASPVLTRANIWAGLRLKIRSAQTFVPGAISSTTVLSESVDPSSGNTVTTRQVVFREDNRRVAETVTAYEDCKVDFVQPDGSTICNLVSENAAGELFMTYIFEWKHPGASPEELAAFKRKEEKMSQMAVEGTIAAMRDLAGAGKI